MNSLLIPTDFSECAKYAENVGIELAKKYGAKLYLFHHVDIPSHWESMTTSEREKHSVGLKRMYAAEKSLNEIRARIPSGIEVETHLTGGNWIERVAQYAEKKNIDMIVIGSHGASGKNEFFIGSNTQKVVRMVHCPTMIIKEPIEKLDFKKVIYASTFDTKEKEAFLKFRNFIKHFMPEFHLLTIHTSGFFDGPISLQREALKDFAELCKPFTTHTHIIDHFTIDGGIRAFAREINADLITVSNHYKRPLKRMLVGSNVETLVNHSEIPVLTIDF